MNMRFRFSVAYCALLKNMLSCVASGQKTHVLFAISMVRQLSEPKQAVKDANPIIAVLESISAGI